MKINHNFAPFDLRIESEHELNMLTTAISVALGAVNFEGMEVEDEDAVLITDYGHTYIDLMLSLFQRGTGVDDTVI